MEDFFYAGGLPVVLREMKDHLHRAVSTLVEFFTKSTIESICKLINSAQLENKKSDAVNEDYQEIFWGNMPEGGE